MTTIPHGSAVEQTDRQMRAALDDPARVDVVITGRNGYQVTHGFAFEDDETVETHRTYDLQHEVQEVDGAEEVSGPPIQRVLSYTWTATRVAHQPSVALEEGQEQ